MKSSIRRELAWLCLPLVLLIGAGAYISRAQNERNARERARNSGPLRVRVWSIINMGVFNEDSKAGYDYGFRIHANINGQESRQLAPGEVWMLRVKSAQIVAGKTVRNARLARVMAPLYYEGKVTIPVADVMEITDISPQPRAGDLWLYCDSTLKNPVLRLRLEAIAGKSVPVPGSRHRKKFVTSGASIVAPVEEIPLRPNNQYHGEHNVIKGGYQPE